MFKITSAALFTAAFAAQTETENFVVSVQGSSGSITVYPKGGKAKDGITVKQDKINFIDGDGKVDGGGMNVAGQNSWSEFAETDGVLSSSFTSEEKGQTFSIRVDIASVSTEVAGPPKDCAGCAAATTGVCQSTVDQACAALVVDAESQETACPLNHTVCTHMYTVRADTVEFTPAFRNFVWPSAEHGLQYGVEVTAPEGEEEDVADEAVESAAGDQYSLSVGHGSVSSATEVLVQDTEGDPARTVSIDAPVIETSGSRTSITWNFPSEAQGAVITFDPSISISSPASWVVPSLMGALLALF